MSAVALSGAVSACGGDDPPRAACGDGVLQAGEGCDDGNTTSGDGCSAACQPEELHRCGDGATDADEECDDGNTTSGDGCSATCQRERAPRCGDGLTDPGEECDDGNTTSNDGCSATCVAEYCGDGHLRPPEDCDGAELNGHSCAEQGFAGGTLGCTSRCTLDVRGCFGPGCGNGVLDPGEACDDGNTDAGDGCRADCLGAELCGDGLLDGAEACDDGNHADGDGCTSTCVVEVCGDGVVNGAGLETCDDGGLVDGDGCSESCLAEPGWELEPNGERTHANDAANVALDGVITARLAPAGDVDVFRVTVPAGALGALDAETLDGPFGTTCASGALDTYIALENASGAVVADAETGGVEQCARLVAVELAEGDWFVAVRAGASHTSTAALDYRLAIALSTSFCGDGRVEGTEGCDDGNRADHDGCSSRCVRERVAEVEPNDAPATATGVHAPQLGDGALAAVDVDVWAISVDTWVDLRVETFDGGGPGSCAGVDTVLDLLGPDGVTLLASDDDGGLDTCSRVVALHLAPGVYFARVSAYDPASVVPAYTLAVTHDAACGDGVRSGSEACDGGPGCTSACERVPVCGDGFVDDPETCDDGNTTAGDGCDASCAREPACGDGFVDPPETCDDANLTDGDGCTSTCTVEAGHAFEVGRTDTLATAGGPFASDVIIHGASAPAGDVDYYAITVAAISDLELQTFDGDPARTSCAGIDTVLALLDATGAELAANDDGGLPACSLLDPAHEPALQRLAPGTYYAAVRPWDPLTALPAYQLVVTFVARCGDGVLGGHEECDDGDTLEGPACTAACTVPRCGDGVVSAAAGELCDDGGTTDGDGCDGNCTPTSCGNGVLTAGEECDDGNRVDGDGCSATCTVPNLCGNGVRDVGEECDDGNHVDGDGCSYATSPRCQIEPGHFFELEPNDDGAVAVATDDFSSALANGPFVDSIIIHGAIAPAGDDDVYAVTNVAASAVTIRLDTYAAAFGLGVPCGTAIDTVLRVRDASGLELAANDDRAGAADRCAGLAYALAAGATVYVQASDFGDDGVIPAYLLRVQVPTCGDGRIESGEECEPPGTATCDASCQRVPVCGDGFVDAPETCDDGNTTSGDGCSTGCLIEGPG